MKILSKFTLATSLLIAAVTSHAEMVSGYFRSNGTYVAPYYRTPANGTVYDNLSYRGYPSQQPGYISPRSSSYESNYGLDSGRINHSSADNSVGTSTRLPSLGIEGNCWQTLPYRIRSARSSPSDR